MMNIEEAREVLRRRELKEANSKEAIKLLRIAMEAENVPFLAVAYIKESQKIRVTVPLFGDRRDNRNRKKLPKSFGGYKLVAHFVKEDLYF